MAEPNPEYPHDPYWPGPKPGARFGFSPPDDLYPRGTPGWKKALNAFRTTKVSNLYQGAERGEVNLSDKDSLDAALARMGITNEVGGGRHFRNLVLGNHQFGGPSNTEGVNSFLDANRPYWKWHMDRALQGGHAVRAGANDPNFPQGSVYSPGAMNLISMPGLGYVGGNGDYEFGAPRSQPFMPSLFPTQFNPTQTGQKGSDATNGMQNPNMFNPQPLFSPTTTMTPTTNMKTGQMGRPKQQTRQRYFRY